MDGFTPDRRDSPWLPPSLAIEILICAFGLTAAIVLGFTLITDPGDAVVIAISSIMLTICVAGMVLMVMNPDTVRARQTDATLHMSREMVDIMADGMTPEAAQAICKMLLPNTAAIAVAITNTEIILGYAGYRESANPQGANIRTQATHEAIADGQTKVLRSPEEIGFDHTHTLIHAAIIVPIRIGPDIRGTLKFYFRSPRKITETQKSIAQGLGDLLSTQFAATELEKQRELATAMELKMLQTQINPHFLFNTINTIASLIRTDAPKARVLLRDFAVFYRSTLENSQDLIPLSREVDQTSRYLSFEMARFGEDRLALSIDLDREDVDILNMEVPPFLLQPLVENAVKHAMPAEGRLLISIASDVDGRDILLIVADDGVGMTEEQREGMFEADSKTGLGIAVRNIRDRMLGYYGPEAKMVVTSELGKGTSIELRFPGMLDDLHEADGTMDVDGIAIDDGIEGRQ